MAGKRHFQPAAERRAVDGGCNRLAASFKAAQQHVEFQIVFVKRFDALFLRLAAIARAGLTAHHGKVGACAERGFAGGQHRTFNGVVTDDLFDNVRQVAHRALAEDVHGAVRHVPGDERNAVAVHFKAKIFVSHKSLLTALPGTSAPGAQKAP